MGGYSAPPYVRIYDSTNAKSRFLHRVLADRYQQTFALMEVALGTVRYSPGCVPLSRYHTTTMSGNVRRRLVLSSGDQRVGYVTHRTTAMTRTARYKPGFTPWTCNASSRGSYLLSNGGHRGYIIADQLPKPCDIPPPKKKRKHVDCLPQGSVSHYSASIQISALFIFSPGDMDCWAIKKDYFFPGCPRIEGQDQGNEKREGEETERIGPEVETWTTRPLLEQAGC